VPINNLECCWFLLSFFQAGLIFVSESLRKNLIKRKQYVTKFKGVRLARRVVAKKTKSYQKQIASLKMIYLSLVVETDQMI
jgi:hypothetical protein